MKRLARRTLVVVEMVTATAAGAVVAGFIFLWHVNNSDYRQEVATIFEQSTGFKVAINGTVRFALMPFPTVIATNVHIANPPWSERPEMMRIDQVDIELSPLDLLWQRSHLPHMTLIGADIHLEYDGHARVNWWQTRDTETTPDPPPAPLDLTRLELIHAAISYRDDSLKRGVELSIEQAVIGLPVEGPLTIAATGAYFGTPFTASLTGGRFVDLINDQPLWPVSWTLKGAETTMEAQGTLDRPMSRLALDLQLSASLRQLAALGPVLGSSSLPELGPLGGSGHVTGSGAHYRVNTLKGFLGLSDFAGQLTFDTSGKRLRLDGQLHSELLDRRDLFGSDKDTPPEPRLRDDRLFDPQPLPFPLLQVINGRVDLAVRRFVMAPADLFDLDTTIDLNDGALVVRPFRARMAGGRIDLAIMINAGREPPTSHITGRSDSLASEQLFPSQGAILGPTGPLSANFDLSGAGASLRAFLAHANGRVWLAIGPGTLPVRHFDLIASDLVAAIMPWADRSGDRTSLNCLITGFRIKNGVADADRLLIDTGKITVTGSGQINLATEGIDLKLDPRPKDPALISLATRMRVTGTLAEHSAAPDAIDLAKDAATGLLLAVGELNPLAFVIPFVSIGTGVANPCQAELADRPSPVGTNMLGPLGGLSDLLSGVGHALNHGLPH